MNDEMNKRVMELRRKEAEAKKRKEAEEERKLAAIGKGLESIRELYLALTDGWDEKTVRASLQLDSGRPADIKMWTDVDNVLTMNVGIMNYSIVSLRIGYTDKDVLIDPEDMVDVIKTHCYSSLTHDLEGIFINGDRFCEKVMDALERQIDESDEDSPAW